MQNIEQIDHVAFEMLAKMPVETIVEHIELVLKWINEYDSEHHSAQGRSALLCLEPLSPEQLKQVSGVKPALEKVEKASRQFSNTGFKLSLLSHLRKKLRTIG